jgi:aryl-alcohol dehydrogenase-like predicted oxidoreductase
MNTSDYRRLGASGMLVSPLGLGTMQFGWTCDEAASFAVMDAFWEANGNFIDTADCYTAWSQDMGGSPNPGGVSEEIIGRWMKARNNRDDIMLATKVRYGMGEGFGEGRNHIHQREGLSRRWIMKACEDSLRRLQVDHIDLYQVHGVDALVPIEETLSALTDLVRRGWVRSIGCSNFSAWRLMEALWERTSNGSCNGCALLTTLRLFLTAHSPAVYSPGNTGKTSRCQLRNAPQKQHNVSLIPTSLSSTR